MRRRITIVSLAVLAIFLLSGTVASPRVYGFANGENASVVLGFSNFTSRNAIAPPNQTSLSGPAGLAFDSNGNLWVADSSNSRILEFKPPFSIGESASVVLGSSSFSAGFSGSSPNQTNLANPFGLAFDSSGNLWTSDTTNNRIVEFKAPFTSGENESLVLGQSSFTSSSSAATQTGLNAPQGIAFDSSGNLWAADQANARVVEFKAPFSTGESESMVIGQTNFTSGVQDIPGCPVSCSSQMTQSSFYQPADVAFDSSGNLWVADARHDDRVLRFPTPLSTGESANLVIGAPDFTSNTFCVDPYATAFCTDFPDYLAFDKSGTLWVNDDTNGRVLGFSPPFSSNQSASIVIGQPSFTNATSVAGNFNATQSSLYGNDGIAIDSSGNLWVSDGLNNRVMEFPAATVSSSTSTTSSAASSSSSSSSASASSPVTTTSVPLTSSLVSTSSSAATTTSSAIAPPSTTTTTSSSSTSISFNYLLVVAVVGIVMVSTLAVFRRRN